ncbi:MAG: bifunctional DNA-formamidopyrimidine glycosylase/DNA-(apurinic or apyrimidinic site) lyase [Planctomycetes bacterium]|nr:bifunctional DNA-formamidopyrimidine glycosylase/DNA-(apurinic or apyrimidinic site) lyase [Planctomycetota bacterium]
MPELPEVETVARALDKAVGGRKIQQIIGISAIRQPFDAEDATAKLAGATILAVRRRAKYLILYCDRAWSVLAHLGMTGSFRLEPAAEPRQPYDRVVFVLDGDEELRFADPRRFGSMRLVQVGAVGEIPAELAGLGPEPLNRAFTSKAMLSRARGRKTPVKVFLMDQKVVAGVGNIYASEALFHAGVDPRRPAGDLSPEEWTAVVAAVKTVLRRAIRRGGTTIRTYRSLDGSEGKFRRSLAVYGRKGETCPSCGRPLVTEKLGGRSTVYCPACQG